MIVTMRTDIHPLCDKHKASRMTLVINVAENIQAQWPAYACSESDCTRQYEIWRGYHDIIDGQIANSDRNFQVICAEDETAMFLETLEPQGGVRLYRCAQLHCARSKTTRQGQ